MRQKYGVDHTRGLIYLRLRRHASRAIEQAWPLLRTEVLRDEAEAIGYPLVFFMRDPVDRVASLYAHSRKLKPTYSQTFRGYVEKIVSKDLAATGNAHFVRVSDCVRGFDIAYAGRIDQFPQSWTRFALPLDLPPLEMIGDLPRDFEIDAESRALIQSYYRDDAALADTIASETPQAPV